LRVALAMKCDLYATAHMFFAAYGIIKGVTETDELIRFFVEAVF